MSASSDPKARPPIGQRKKARSLLIQALYQWQIADYPIADIEAQYRADNTGKIDWDYFHELFTGIAKDAQTLDDSLIPCLDRDISQLDPIELAIMRLGSYELTHRIDIPYRVVINESIELAKKYGATDSHKYVNGILDKLARQCRTVEKNAEQSVDQNSSKDTGA